MSKIAFICNFFPSISETFIYRETLGLKKKGFSIKVFSIRNPKKENISEEVHDIHKSTTYLLPVDLKLFLKAHLYFLLKQPLKYFYLLAFLLSRKYNNKIKDRKRTFYHFLEGVILAKLILQEGNIEHLHAHYISHPCTLAFVVSSFTDIPFSATAHAHDIWLDKLFIKEKIERAKFIITCSEYGRKRIIDDNNIRETDKIYTIYHGIDTLAFKQKQQLNKKDKFTILNVGSLLEVKDQRNLILACKILKEEGYDFQCNIVGDGPLYARLKELIHECELTEEVQLAGRVFQENIKNHYQEADIFVLTSNSENLPNVLLESMAMGVPVIATQIGGIPELIINRETGLLISANNVEEIANAIKLLMNDKALYEKLSLNGKMQVSKNFDFRKSIDKIINIYRTHGII